MQAIYFVFQSDLKCLKYFAYFEMIFAIHCLGLHYHSIVYTAENALSIYVRNGIFSVCVPFILNGFQWCVENSKKLFVENSTFLKYRNVGIENYGETTSTTVVVMKYFHNLDAYGNKKKRIVSHFVKFVPLNLIVSLK